MNRVLYDAYLQRDRADQYVYLLRRAHSRISAAPMLSGADTVCVALMAPQHTRLQSASYNLRAMIGAALCGNTSVFRWLLSQPSVDARDLTCANLRAYRLRWIEAMIRDIEEWAMP